MAYTMVMTMVDVESNNSNHSGTNIKIDFKDKQACKFCGETDFMVNWKTTRVAIRGGLSDQIQLGVLIIF